MINDSIIQKFDEIWFHDLGVKNLSIDFEKREIKIVFEEYDDFKKDYFPLTVTLSKITKLVSDYPSDEFDYSVTGCNNAKIKKKSSSYEVEFIFEIDNQAVYSLLIAFQSLEIHRTLSPLAIEYKNTHFESRMDEREWLEKHHLPLV